MPIMKCRTYDDSPQFGGSIGRNIILIHSNKLNGVAGIDVNAVNKAVEKYYPEYSAKNVVVYKNTVFVNLVPKVDSGGFQLMEWHAIDPKSGQITGSIPVDDLFSDSTFLNALKNSIRMNDHLEHHGILGQKWGVRRFQNPDGTWTAEGKKRYGHSGVGRTSRDDDIKYGGSGLATTKSVAKSFARTALSVIPGVGIAMTAYDAAKAAKAVSDYATMHLSSEEKQDQKLAKYADVDHKFKSEKDVNKIDGPHDEKSDMAAVNPSKKNIMSGPGSSNNCMFCTTTYDLRRRGYDVTARAGFGRSTSDVTKWYKNCKIEKSDSKTWKEFSSKLSKMPVGARGNLMVRPSKDYASINLSGGHSMIWEMTNKGLVIRDAQVNKTYRPDGFYMMSTWDVKTATYARTDNCQVNWKAVNECTANRRRDK